MLAALPWQGGRAHGAEVPGALGDIVLGTVLEARCLSHGGRPQGEIFYVITAPPAALGGGILVSAVGFGVGDPYYERWHESTYGALGDPASVSPLRLCRAPARLCPIARANTVHHDEWRL